MFRPMWLRVLCVVLGLVLWSGSAAATNFAVLFGGVGGGDEDLECEGVEISDLEFEAPVVAMGPNGTAYTRPGKVKPVRIILKRGEVTDKARVSPGFAAWIKEYEAGLRSERAITVLALKGEKPPRCEGCAPPWLELAVARYAFPACEIDAIVEESVVQADGSVGVMQTLELRTKKPPKIGSITKGGLSGKPILRVGMAGPNGGLVEEGLTGWSGGEVARVVSGPFASALYHGPSPDTFLRDLLLYNDGLPGLPAVYDWLNLCIEGSAEARRVTVTELRPNGRPHGRTYSLFDCFPVRYVFPRFGEDVPVEGGGEQLRVRSTRGGGDIAW